MVIYFFNKYFKNKTILIVFLIFTARNIEKEIFKNSATDIYFFNTSLFLFNIFNSFIAVDFEMSAIRNFGFIRFILLFIAIKNFFNSYNKANNIFRFWFLIIIIVVFDSFIEFSTGRNKKIHILGYGEKYGEED